VDSVVYVTGASRGIGRAVSLAACAHGARVGLLSRSETDLKELASSLGGRAAFAAADVADHAAVERAFAELQERIGPPDILVNNAGIGSYRSFLEEDLETFRRLMQVNYFGTVHATRAALPGMADRGHGHIVNIASVAGLVGAPFETAYSASKFAVVGLTESLTAEVAALGIRVSLVDPGPTRTSFTEARGVPFQRKYPRPLPAARVAEAVIDVVEHDHYERVLPRWLRIAPVTRALVPDRFRAGMIRDFRDQSRQLAERWRAR